MYSVTTAASCVVEFAVLKIWLAKSKPAACSVAERTANFVSDTYIGDAQSARYKNTMTVGSPTKITRRFCQGASLRQTVFAFVFHEDTGGTAFSGTAPMTGFTGSVVLFSIANFRVTLNRVFNLREIRHGAVV